MKHKIFTLLFAMMASVGVVSASVIIDGITYNLYETELTAEVTRSGGNNYSDSIVIPFSIINNGQAYSVTSIGNDAFLDCTEVTSVTIPNSVISIGDNAFHRCYSLTSITIPNSVTSIGEGAFFNCVVLTSVTIPSSVTSIGDHAFWWCSKLTSVTINSNAIVSDLGKSVLDIFDSQVLEYIISNSISSIGDHAFSNCSGLTTVTIPNSVTSIGDYAFSGCTSLTSLTIPNSVTSIGSDAFYNVPNVIYNGTAVGLPWGARCVNGYVDGWLVYTDAFKTQLAACSSSARGEISIPNSVISIGNNAFYKCENLTSVIIPNSVISIGEWAFFQCSGLTSVTICNSVTSIGPLAFSFCASLTSLTCYATTPPVFDGPAVDDYSKITLYVPAESIGKYKVADYWKEFNTILPISAKEAETDIVKTESTEHSVEIVWPIVSGANTYELVIRDETGNVICSLVFNSNGQLVSIAFAPARDGAPQKTQETGFSFTVTGLDSGASYVLTITAKNDNGQIIDIKEVSFTMADDAQGIEELQEKPQQSTKILRDGQILIQRGEKVYTLQGQEVR